MCLCVCVSMCVCARARVRAEAAASGDIHLRLGAAVDGRKISAGDKVGYVNCTQRDTETVRPVISSLNVVQSSISIIAVTLVVLVALTGPFGSFSPVFTRKHSPSILNTSTSDNFLFSDDQAFTAGVFNASPSDNKAPVDVISSPAGVCNERGSCLNVGIWHSRRLHLRHALTHAQLHTITLQARTRAFTNTRVRACAPTHDAQQPCTHVCARTHTNTHTGAACSWLKRLRARGKRS